MSAPEFERIALADGRALDLVDAGEMSSIALVLHHGTPGDASMWTSWSDACARAGFRLIAISRAGYGGSSRRPGRRIADVADDVREVLDARGIDTFVTAGASGGGPHALACAALLAPRCRAAATFAGVGPYGVEGLDFLDGMGPENHEEFGAALRGEPSLRAWMEHNGDAFRRVTTDEVIAAFGELVSEIDRAALAAGEAESIAHTMRRALAPGFDGWIDDDLAHVQAWGFDPAAIAVPVTVWQGDADRMVPHAHGRWLAAHVPGARLAFAPGEGHISILTNHRDVMLRELAEAANAP